MMRMLFSLAAAGLVGTGLLLGAPTAAHAQGIYHNGSYYRGGYSAGYVPHNNSYYSYRPSYGYGSYYNPGYSTGNGYGNYYARHGYQGRQVIVHPTTIHWTPSRGLHTHGHIHVPHRGHYHTLPY